MVNIYDPALQHAIKEIVLDRFQVGVHANIAEEALSASFRPIVEVTADRMYEQIRIFVKGSVMGQKLDEFKYPENWKEAFKERWFPEWYKKRKPIKYANYQVRAFYPDLAFPDKAHLTVARFDVEPLKPWKALGNRKKYLTNGDEHVIHNVKE